MSSDNTCSLLILFTLLLLLNVGSADLTISKSCPSQCGGIDIPYPFGVGNGCYLEKWYEIECVNSSKSGMLEPFLSVIQKRVESISVSSNLPNRLDPRTYGSVFIRNQITSKGCSNDEEKPASLLNLTGTPFFVGYRNTLQVFGCNNTASLTNVEPNMVGCRSSCSAENQTISKDYFALINYCDNKSFGADSSPHICDRVSETSCNGIGCCKASMPDGVQQVVGVKIEDNNSTTAMCKVAFLTTLPYYGFTPQEIHALEYSTIELGWSIYTTNVSFIHSLGCQNLTEYQKRRSFDPKTSCICDYNVDLTYASCGCNSGYRGSPYTGCKDIDECHEFAYDNRTLKGYCERGRTCVNRQGGYACVYPKTRLIGIGLGTSIGLLIVSGGIYWLYKFIRRQRRLNRKKKFFKRNGGLLLQQQLTSTEGNIEKTRVFSSRELEKATENFSLDRILGQGGQGTVYKGMLVDGRIVAVKKSKVVDEDKLEEFINEVVILSQINHRNIVKLLGCCLETNVPLLVYEFIPNGNLFEHIHDELDDYTMITWEVRLRIAVDIAGALSYLHSAASSPIYHRDVKSTNIMLDEKYRAKVSDFGTSRSVTMDHTHLTTVVSGTMGYMDPEYFQSSQFTDKSDVYSFGVVLAELITGEKSISFSRSQENRTLATYFIFSTKENKLFDIIDSRIKSGCKLDQVTAAAKIARRCLNMKGKKRPNMRQVLMELERIRLSLGDKEQHGYVSEDEEENEEGVVDVNIEVESWNNVAITAPASKYNIVASYPSWSDVEPLFPLHTG